MLRYCSHADCRRFWHPSDFESEFDSEDPRATCRRHRISSAKSPCGSKKVSPEAKKESKGHGARVRGAAAWNAGGEGLMEETSIMGHETEEPPAKQLCFRSCGGARVHAPARSPGDSSTLPSRPTATPPAIEVSEADINHPVDTIWAACDGAARDDSPDFSLDELLVMMLDEVSEADMRRVVDTVWEARDGAARDDSPDFSLDELLVMMLDEVSEADMRRVVEEAATCCRGAAKRGGGRRCCRRWRCSRGACSRGGCGRGGMHAQDCPRPRQALCSYAQVTGSDGACTPSCCRANRRRPGRSHGTARTFIQDQDGSLQGLGRGWQLPIWSQVLVRARQGGARTEGVDSDLLRCGFTTAD